MGKYVRQLPVLLDHSCLVCDLCNSELFTLCLVGIETLPQMWRVNLLREKRYKQLLVSRVVCLDCFGFQTWSVTLAHLVCFTYRKQLFLREKGTNFQTAWETAREAHETGVVEHTERLKKRESARIAQQWQINEPLRVKLLRIKAEEELQKYEYID